MTPNVGTVMSDLAKENERLKKENEQLRQQLNDIMTKLRGQVIRTPVPRGGLT